MVEKKSLTVPPMRTSPMLTVISERPSGDAGTQAFRSEGTPAQAPVRSAVPRRGSATVARPGEHSRPTSPACAMVTRPSGHVSRGHRQVARCSAPDSRACPCSGRSHRRCLLAAAT